LYYMKPENLVVVVIIIIFTTISRY